MKAHHKLKTAAALAVLAFAAVSAQAQVITAWSFNNLTGGANNAPLPSTGTGSAMPLGMTNNYTYANAVTGSVANADILAGANGSNEWRVRGGSPGNGWNLAAPQYTQGAQFSASTAGLSNIVFSYDWFSTTQGVRNLQAQYTTDGSSWINVGPLQVAPPESYQTGLTINFGALGITAVDNNASFAVRLVSAFEPTLGTYARATQTGGLLPINNSSGNWRFDNISVSAVPEPHSVALLLAGLVMVGAAARRRRG